MATCESPSRDFPGTLEHLTITSFPKHILTQIFNHIQPLKPFDWDHVKRLPHPSHRGRPYELHLGQVRQETVERGYELFLKDEERWEALRILEMNFTDGRGVWNVRVVKKVIGMVNFGGLRELAISGVFADCQDDVDATARAIVRAMEGCEELRLQKLSFSIGRYVMTSSAMLAMLAHLQRAPLKTLILRYYPLAVDDARLMVLPADLAFPRLRKVTLSNVAFPNFSTMGPKLESVCIGTSSNSVCTAIPPPFSFATLSNASSLITFNWIGSHFGVYDIPILPTVTQFEFRSQKFDRPPLIVDLAAVLSKFPAVTTLSVMNSSLTRAYTSADISALLISTSVRLRRFKCMVSDWDVANLKRGFRAQKSLER
ncbi:hypothetical protein HK097_007266, partial [Rhizophlyctis rosea]